MRQPTQLDTRHKVWCLIHPCSCSLLVCLLHINGIGEGAELHIKLPARDESWLMGLGTMHSISMTSSLFSKSQCMPQEKTRTQETTCLFPNHFLITDLCNIRSSFCPRTPHWWVRLLSHPFLCATSTLHIYLVSVHTVN